MFTYYYSQQTKLQEGNVLTAVRLYMWDVSQHALGQGVYSSVYLARGCIPACTWPRDASQHVLGQGGVFQRALGQVVYSSVQLVVWTGDVYGQGVCGQGGLVRRVWTEGVYTPHTYALESGAATEVGSMQHTEIHLYVTKCKKNQTWHWWKRNKIVMYKQGPKVHWHIMCEFAFFFSFDIVVYSSISLISSFHIRIHYRLVWTSPYLCRSRPRTPLFLYATHHCRILWTWCYETVIPPQRTL